MSDPASARAFMIEGQMRPNGITDPAVLKAFAAVPREQFAPPTLHGAAYVDGPLPLGGGRFLMEPMLLAKMIQQGRASGAARVLDVCCGSGYAAAVLARLAGRVVATEPDPALLGWARRELFGLANVELATGSPEAGYPASGPYDLIIVEGALSAVPQSLVQQLADKGRLVFAHQGESHRGALVLLERIGEATSRRTICDAWLRPVPGYETRDAFVL